MGRTSTGQQVSESQLDYITSFSSQGYTNSAVGTVTSVPTWTGNWFTAFWQCATVHPSFMQGAGYDIVYYIIILPFVAIPGTTCNCIRTLYGINITNTVVTKEKEYEYEYEYKNKNV